MCYQRALLVRPDYAVAFGKCTFLGRSFIFIAMRLLSTGDFHLYSTLYSSILIDAFLLVSVFIDVFAQNYLIISYCFYF